MIDYIVIVAYFAALLVAGYVGLRKARDTTGFVLAGRRLGPFMYVGALSTVVLGGTSTIGGMSLGYRFGISGAVLVFMLALGIMAIGVCFSRVLYKYDLYTVAQVLGRRYGVSARRISAVVVVFYTLMVGVSQILAIGTIFNVVLGMSPTPAIIVGFAVTMAYCVAGGMWSITLTDIMQFVVMTVGIFGLLAPLVIGGAGGFGHMTEVLPADFFHPTGIGWPTILAYFLLFFFGFMVDQGNWQRIGTARSPKVAMWGCVAAGVYCLLYGGAAALAGAAARVIFPHLADPDQAFASVAKAVLPAGVLGVVLAAGLAAAMSTASGLLIGGSTVAVQDLYADVSPRRAKTVGANRLALLALSLVALVLSFVFSSVVTATTVAADLLASSLFVPVVAALFWRRATTPGAVTSMIVSALVTVAMMAWYGIDANEPVMYGLLSSVIVFVAVSLATFRRHPAASLRTETEEPVAA